MGLFDGLFGYEKVMIVLGIALFLVSLVGVIVFIIQKRNIKVWVTFVVISVVMIGWPSIQSVSIENGLVSVEKTAEEVQRGQATAEQVSDLRNTVEGLEGRPLSAPSRITLARGQAALGDKDKAIATLDEVIREMPRNRQAAELREALRR